MIHYEYLNIDRSFLLRTILFPEFSVVSLNILNSLLLLLRGLNLISFEQLQILTISTI